MGQRRGEGPVGRSAAARTAKRAARLGGLTAATGPSGTALDSQVSAARIRVWLGSRPRTVPLRLGLLRDRGPQEDSPLRAVSTPKGCAVQLLLVALFEVTCRRTRIESGRATTRALRHSEVEGRPSWHELVATPTVNRRRSTGTARTPDDNRYDQLRSALLHLETHGRIRAPYPEGRGRFEGFTLLNESSNNRTGSPTTYGRPNDDEPTVDVPVEFWINGWVHALYDNEIAAYLFLLAASQQDLRAGGDGQASVSAEDWQWAFGSDRAGLQAQRELARFGLIHVERPAARRANGTVEGGGAEDAELPSTPHRYRPLDDGLHFPAVPTMLKSLQYANPQSTRHGLDLDQATAFVHLTSPPPGSWTFANAKAQLEQDRLAAPPASR